MKLEISCGPKRMEVEITETSGQRRVRVGGLEAVCDWVRMSDGQYSLILDGRVYDLTIILDTDSCSIAGREGTHQFQIFDPRRLSHQQDIEEGYAGLQRINAEMPGKVVRLLVKQGGAVACDQGLLVLEAMKMQNEIRSPKSGVVTEIGVRDGCAVNTGDFLLSIE